MRIRFTRIATSLTATVTAVTIAATPVASGWHGGHAGGHHDSGVGHVDWGWFPWDTGDSDATTGGYGIGASGQQSNNTWPPGAGYLRGGGNASVTPIVTPDQPAP
jgi:hypothetical protein